MISSSRWPGESSTGVVGSIRLPIAIWPSHRSWRCLISTGDSCCFARAGSHRPVRRSKRSHQLYPVGPLLDEAAGLQMYDRHAREVARQVRTIAEHYPDKPVAA